MTPTAEELGISQSAVSHQLRRLQDHLGEKLVERHGRDFGLTVAGERLAASLGSAFDMLEHSTALVSGANRPMLRVGVYSSFAIGWLIPLMPSFHEKHPEVDLRLTMLYDPHEISGRIADIFVTSEPIERGYRAIRLFPEKLVPVIRATTDAGEVVPSTLITSEVEASLAGRDWEAFCVLNETPLPAVPLLCCSHYIFSLEMVLAGMGASLIPDFLADPYIRCGKLRRLLGKPLPTGQIYQIQFKYERRKEPDINSFVAWLQGALASRSNEV